MKNPLRTAEDYEFYLYTIKDAFSIIQHSTLVFIRRGSSLARVSGELHFAQQIRLVIRERLIFDGYLLLLIGMVMKFGREIKNYIGMILNHTRTIRLSKSLIPITSIFNQI